MLDCGITTYVLLIIWLFSFLMIITFLNTGRTPGRTTLIIATIITAFFRFMPAENLREIANNFLNNVYITFPVIVISILSGLIIGYIFLNRYLFRQQPKDRPPKFMESDSE